MQSFSVLCFLCLGVGTMALPSVMTIWNELQLSYKPTIPYSPIVAHFATSLSNGLAYSNTQQSPAADAVSYFKREDSLGMVTGNMTDQDIVKAAVDTLQIILKLPNLPSTPNRAIGLALLKESNKICLITVITDPMNIVTLPRIPVSYIRTSLADIWNNAKSSSWKAVPYTSNNAVKARDILTTMDKSIKATNSFTITNQNCYSGLIVIATNALTVTCSDYDQKVYDCIDPFMNLMINELEKIKASKGAITIATSADDGVDVYSRINPYFMISFVISPLSA